MAETATLKVSRVGRFQFSPEAFYVYRPRPDGTGTAMKLNLRLEPKIHDEGYMEDVGGGLFLDLAGQKAKGKNPHFDWQGNDRMTTKLGLLDITTLILAIEHMRQHKAALVFEDRVLPPSIQNLKDSDLKRGSRTVSLFHKFGDSSTAINYQFEEGQSYLQLSKPPKKAGEKPMRKSVAISLTDEVAFLAYLKQALDAFLRLGVR